MSTEVIAGQNTLHPKKHQFVVGGKTHHPILSERAVEQERVRPATRRHQVIARATNKHVVARAANQMIVAIEPEQPVTVGMRLERIGAVGALHAGFVRRHIAASLQTAGRDAVGHIVLEQPRESRAPW